MDKEPRPACPASRWSSPSCTPGGKFGGGSYAATGGLHGVGASVVNALSARLDAEVDRSPATQHLSFQRGVPGVFDGRGPRRPLLAAVRAAQGQAGGQEPHRHPDPLLARPADLHQGRHLPVRGPARPRPADLVHRPGAGDRGHRPAGGGATRAGHRVVQARRRDLGVLRVPRPRRGGHRHPAAAGLGRVHRDGAAARRQGAHDPPGRRARAARRRGGALGPRTTRPRSGPSST